MERKIISFPADKNTDTKLINEIQTNNKCLIYIVNIFQVII